MKRRTQVQSFAPLARLLSIEMRNLVIFISMGACLKVLAEHAQLTILKSPLEKKWVHKY